MVVGAGVDDRVLDVVLGRCGLVGLIGLEAELQHQHPGQAELVAQPLAPAGVITPRSSATSGSSPELARRRVEQRAPGPALPVPGDRRRDPAGTAQ